MGIAGYDITMSMEHKTVQMYQQSQKLTYIQGNRAKGPTIQQSPANDRLNLSNNAKSLLNGSKDLTKGYEIDGTDPFKVKDFKLMVLKTLLEKLTGRKINILDLENMLQGKGQEGGSQASGDAAQAKPQQQAGTAPLDAIAAALGGQGSPANSQASAGASQNWAASYESHETYYESEELNFKAGGTIKTTDGQEIQFSLELNMSREFLSQTDINVKAGNTRLLDPLVVNYGGTAAELSDTKFLFDLNKDGKDDNVPNLGPQSGFLVLDKNSDGKINDGGELFGALTGNGFQELAAYDANKDGWIDKNDPIYNNLALWDKQGNNKEGDKKDAPQAKDMYTLAEKGIQGLFTGSLDAPFAIKNQDNALQGAMKKMGLYLDDQGKAGTLQQIDVAA